MKLNKGFSVFWFVGIIAIILVIVGVVVFSRNEDIVLPPKVSVYSDTQQTMFLDVFVQDREAAIKSDCRVTIKQTHQIPKTFAVADASLRILFDNELALYGEYESVIILNEVARVSLRSDNLPDGKPISALSSCESGHLMAVLTDTLTQYPTIKKVELYSPNGKIEF